ncbi:Uncharacterized protein GBIM_13742 [Gryllus bimaculatus]|nr:Uncharacterized protein GBIM_13742 [Gryllus bimaculatus]
MPSQGLFTWNVLGRLLAALALAVTAGAAARECDAGGQRFKYMWGDALSDSADCLGPNGAPYPAAAVARMFRPGGGSRAWFSERQGRALATADPHAVRRALLHRYRNVNDAGGGDGRASSRAGRGGDSLIGRDTCGGTPARLCKTRYNTTAPMYGVSLTSGQPVTIVQKFPDLLQQVVFEVCESNECDVVRGECTQTYVPYLFLVIPLGPVTLTGQDYVLVESGCVCKPKYAVPSGSEPSAISAIPQL